MANRVYLESEQVYPVRVLVESSAGPMSLDVTDLVSPELLERYSAALIEWDAVQGELTAIERKFYDAGEEVKG